MSDDETDQAPPQIDGTRRGFISGASTLAMFAGLAGGYGGFGLIAGRFLYPAKPDPKAWMFLCETGRMRMGDSLLYRAPGGETVNVARQGQSGGVEDFIALSSTCPHLGCQVHWEPQNDRFFCPCHNGVFTPSGVGIGGPPGDAGQSLPRYNLKLEGALLYIEVPVRGVAAGSDPTGKDQLAAGQLVQGEAHCGPGHDPCLYTCADRRRTIRLDPAHQTDDKA